MSSTPAPRQVTISPIAGYAAPPTKTCPACAETVKSAAKVCRFYGHRMSEGVEPIASTVVALLWLIRREDILRSEWMNFGPSASFV